MANDIVLGQIITGTAYKDAVHVPIAPVVAAHTLCGGDKVILQKVDGCAVLAQPNDKPVGVVDPFLNDYVEEGQTFWLFLMPGSISTMRHEWTHPGVDQQPTDSADAFAGLKAFADDLGVKFQELLERADDFVASGDRWVKNRFEGGVSMPARFWEWYAEVRNVPLPKLGPDSWDRNFFDCGGCSNEEDEY